VTSLVCGYFLPYLLERFRSTFPQVEVRVVEDQRDYIEHLLVNGELDAAVFIVSNVQNRQALHTEVLQQSSYRLWLPAGHRLLDGGMVTLSIWRISRWWR
jgi:DNA-binding transcriptional LysR family regulator